MNQKKTNRGKYIAWIFIPSVLAFIIQFLASVFVMEGGVVYILGTFKGKTITDLLNSIYDMAFSTSLNGMIYVLYSVIGIVLFLNYFNKMFMVEKSYSLKGVSKNVPATIGGILLFCIGMQYVSTFLTSALASAFPTWWEQYEMIMDSLGLEEEVSVLILLYTWILGPIVEELTFRGLTLSAAKKVMPYYMAIIVQAILFGAFHMNPIQSCYAFVLGLGLGYIMHIYDNIIITILIHIVFNFIGTVGAAFLPIGGNTLISFFAWLLGSLIVSYIGLVLLKKGAAAVKEDDFFADI